jgi:hypothetical protein
MKTIDMESLLKIFNLKKKKELINYCKNVQIYQSDFVAFISACKSGVTEYNYDFHFDDKVPVHLQLNESDRAALATHGIGIAKGKAKTTINKIFQTFEERKCRIAHLFYTGDLKYWYLFYFDNRDLNEYKNHWKRGKHIHLINDLWFPNMNAEEAWLQFWTEKLKMSSKVHIRYLEKIKA